MASGDLMKGTSFAQPSRAMPSFGTSFGHRNNCSMSQVAMGRVYQTTNAITTLRFGRITGQRLTLPPACGQIQFDPMAGIIHQTRQIGRDGASQWSATTVVPESFGEN